jgi:hypothetical protein
MSISNAGESFDLARISSNLGNFGHYGNLFGANKSLQIVAGYLKGRELRGGPGWTLLSKMLTDFTDADPRPLCL